MPDGQQASAQPRTPPQGNTGHHPIFIGIVAVGMLAIFTVGLMGQVATNEAQITGNGSVDVFKPDWDLFTQIPRMFTGDLPGQLGMAAVVGWGVVLLYLGCVIGYEHLHKAASKSGNLMAKLFKFGVIAIIIYNMYTDFKFGTIGINGFWGHAIFAIMMSFIVGYFGTMGIHLLIMAWGKG